MNFFIEKKTKMPIYNIQSGWYFPRARIFPDEEEEYWFIYGDDEENNFGIEYDYGSDDDEDDEDDDDDDD